MGGRVVPMVAVSFGSGIATATRDTLIVVAEQAMRLRYGATATRDADRQNLVVLNTLANARDGVLPLTIGATTSRRLPPWAQARIHPDGMDVETDTIGLKHVYVVRGQHWAATATSALVLGALAGGDLDELAWAAMALTGYLVGERTIFRGVERLPGNVRARLMAGRLDVTRTATPDTAPPETGAEAVRIAADDCLEAAPAAGLELSGGLDSRVMLAAVSPDQRRGRHALTLGDDDAADVVIARSIARQARLDHHVIAVDSDDTPQAWLPRVRAAALARDALANGPADAVLDYVEDRAAPGPRFTGVNGEYGRGFYYPGVLPCALVSRSSVRRLARWRMFTNQRAGKGLFAPGWLSDVEDDVVASIIDSVRACGSSLRTASDEFYLHHRLPQWAGPGYSREAERRHVLAPFLHPAFLAWVKSLAASERAGSRALCRALVDLDPWLASLPLAGGLPPSDLAAQGVAARCRRGVLWTERVGAKIRQRAQRAGRPAIGARDVAAAVASEWHATASYESLADVEFLAPGFAIQPDPASLSYLLNLETAVCFVRDVHTAVRERAT